MVVGGPRLFTITLARVVRVSSFVVRTVVRCDPDAAFRAGSDIDLHLVSMADSGERAVGH